MGKGKYQKEASLFPFQISRIDVLWFCQTIIAPNVDNAKQASPIFFQLFKADGHYLCLANIATEVDDA